MRLRTGSALNHFRKTNGPPGFLWKFVLFYLLVFGLVQIAGLAVNWPIYEIYAEVFADGFDLEILNDRMQPYQWRSTLWSLVSLPIWLLISVFTEGAIQRRYMRGEGFAIRWGGDEKRLTVVMLIWFGLIIAAYIALIIATLIVTLIAILLGSALPALGVAIAVVFGLAFLGAVLFFVTRLSAASALTVRDRQVRFFQSWGVTRGRWRSMFNAFIILSVIAIIGITVLYALGFLIGYAQVEPLLRGEDADVAAIVAKLFSPGVLLPLGLLMGVYTAAAAVLYYVWSGIGALAAKTDPEWAGQIGIAAEFD